MTHDKLLAKINKIEENACWYQQSDGQCNDMHNVICALRAVVELITKEATIPLDDYHFGYMAVCKKMYETIEKELQ